MAFRSGLSNWVDKADTDIAKTGKTHLGDRKPRELDLLRRRGQGKRLRAEPSIMSNLELRKEKESTNKLK